MELQEELDSRVIPRVGFFRSCLLFRELFSLAKCKVRGKTTLRQFVNNKVCETLSDLGYYLYKVLLFSSVLAMLH